MPTHTKRLSDNEARKIAAPETSYAIHWCPSTPGFGLRVTANGARAWIIERRVDGKTVRRTLGAASGRGAVSADTARGLALDTSSSLQRGVDPLEVKRERIAAAKVDGATFGDALRDYVKGKRRAKDGLPLKERTRADYLAMVEPGHTLKSGKPTLDGALHAIADMPLARITAEKIRDLHKALVPRGERRQTYAMQVLRAVLRHHGVVIDDNPLSPTTAGKSRVMLAPSRGKPSPIPPERLGGWWRAACAVHTPSADTLRFALLTGCRPGEAAGITAADVDIKGGRVTLRDTKNRLDHVLLLSTQALDIVKAHTKGKKAGAAVFGIADAGKTLATINAAAEVVDVSQHKLRHTFASVAAELVPVYTLKKMLNHLTAGDVTGTSYVNVSEAQLRAGWQAVADHIAQAA
jgi:integrase